MIKMALACLVILCLNATAVAAKEEGTVFDDEALVLNELGVFDGKSTAYFEPALQDGLTREEGMKLLSEVFLWEVEENGVSRFSDVSGWAQPYVKVAVSRGVTNGIGGGLFGGSESVTYQQFYTWILREMGYENIYDINSSTWDGNIREEIRNLGLLFTEVGNYNQPINRDYAVGIMHGLLPLKRTPGEETIVQQIIGRNGMSSLSAETKSDFVSGKTATLSFAESFLQNGVSQVRVQDSDMLIVELAEPVDDVSKMEFAVCGQNLCVFISSRSVQTVEPGVYEVTLAKTLTSGSVYYISSIIVESTGGSTTEIGYVAKSQVLVVENDMTPDTVVYEITSREELDRFIAYSDQYLVIDFYADWCGYCVLMEPTFMDAARIMEHEAMFVKVNVDEVDVSGFGIRGIPHQSFYYNGEKAGEFIGYYSSTPASYASLVRSYR